MDISTPLAYRPSLRREALEDMARNGRRLIEDYLPIREISAEASREKTLRKGHISTLHLWWARRPLVACRAAIYAALVPADVIPGSVTFYQPQDDLSETEKIKEAVARAYRRGQAGNFIKDLCKYPGNPSTIAEAQRQILATHAAKLSIDQGEDVTVEDILEGRAPRPRLLDMFAGGGSIPLEALRLGCDAYALDINPVAHIIELCTLVYPQKYGQPDKSVKGTAKDGTWAGLDEEVRFWGKWVLDRVKAEIGDLYPSIPDPKAPAEPLDGERFLPGMDPGGRLTVPARHLTPIAYLWTRTVRCKNPTCGAKVPLVRQTWLCKGKGRCVALKTTAPKGQKSVQFEVVQGIYEKDIGFDPAAFSRGGNATCFFCGTVANAQYVQAEGKGGSISTQLMAVVCSPARGKGKVYLAGAEISDRLLPNEPLIQERIARLCADAEITVPSEQISPLRPSPNARGMSAITRYGFTTFGALFTPRQQLCLLTFTKAIRNIYSKLRDEGYESSRTIAVQTYLALVLDKIAEISNSFARWEPVAQCTRTLFGRQALPMLWDFGETVPIATSAGNWNEHLRRVIDSIQLASGAGSPASLRRGTATELPWPSTYFDALITDPPYYDNVPYADLSDFFYVWLKRSIGHLFPEHFSGDLTPKKGEATALSSRHKGDMEAARIHYESAMLEAFLEGSRVLKPGGQMTVVYAHKTTLGWATLVDALRRAGFIVVEAWPLRTEMKSRLTAKETSALVNSIFLVASKRNGAGSGSYEELVRPELEKIVRERVDTLWKLGITGADLIIAAVGAGLRAFTQHQRVEFANGDEVPSTTFLKEVEGVVHEALLERLFSGPRIGVAATDPASRFYILWRYTYGAAELEAGEAIVFTYGLDVELDNGLSSGSRALIQKKKSKYRLRDFGERGSDRKLGLTDDRGQAAPLVDILHRILWLTEHEPRSLGRFLREADPDRERLRLIASVLAGPGLKGSTEGQSATVVTTTAAEQSALGKLLANWRSLMSSDNPLFPQP